MLMRESSNTVFKVGGTAAILALLALMATFVAFAMAGVMGGEGVEQLLPLIYQNRQVFMVAYIAVGLISLFDIFTVPGLFLAAREGSQTYAVWGAILAVVGDVFGMIAGVIQLALLRLSASHAAAVGAGQTGILLNAQLVETLERVFTTAGFLLVGPSFLFFGLAFLRGSFGKWIGWVGIVAGILTIAGLLPSLAILSLGANVLYLVWYIAIGLKFFKFVRQSPRMRINADHLPGDAVIDPKQ